MPEPVRAWTLGFPPGYESAVRVPGNAKAPGGYAFRSKGDAIGYALSHPEAGRYGPYEIQLPDTFEACTTRTPMVAAIARHVWHTDGGKVRAVMHECGICRPGILASSLDCDLLTTCAPFINPDTGTVTPKETDGNI